MFFGFFFFFALQFQLFHILCIFFSVSFTIEGALLPMTQKILCLGIDGQKIFNESSETYEQGELGQNYLLKRKWKTTKMPTLGDWLNKLWNMSTKE